MSATRDPPAGLCPKQLLYQPAARLLGRSRSLTLSSFTWISRCSTMMVQVFDVELRAVRNCRRRQVAMFSDVVCE